MAPHFVRAHGAYKVIQIHSFHHTHTDARSPPHTHTHGTHTHTHTHNKYMQ